MKTATIRARIEPELKINAEKILNTLGLSTTEAITLFYRQIELTNGLPFRVELPNKTTEKTFKETDQGENLITCKDDSDLFSKLGI